MNLPGVYDTFLARWGEYQTCYIISDPHFGDAELAAGTPGRPSDEELIKLINSKVGRKDVLIILGDIGDIECAKRLRGYKVLVAGNHDKGMTAYEEVFKEIYSGPVMIGEKLILSHEPLPITWAINIHGHVHDKRHRNDKYHFNVCCDTIGYLPINFNQWLKEGHLAHIQSIHRTTIDTATARKAKRKGSKK